MRLGSPLLGIRRIVFARDGQPVEYISALYRPDRYQYRMNLTRIGGDAERSWSMDGT